ncbi:MAG: HIT family protein [Candidatus Magasanikbacteria bacterium]|nr:HIT family protein [Candidatus Magasanikbacteria bacterium]
MSCIFCDIASGAAPSFKVWEDENYLAFLSIFPNTRGTTVVIPKAHHESYVFAADPSVMHGLMDAARKVAAMIDRGFDDVGRTGLIFEGFGVNHLHAKLFPMHGTRTEGWQPHNSAERKVFDLYEGYLSSHDGPRADDEELREVQGEIVGDKKSVI